MQIEKLVPKGVLPPLIRMNRAFGYMALAKCAAYLQQPVAIHPSLRALLVRPQKG
jgi:hypothetical protein